MKRWLRQTLRGCKTLPIVGEHPGIFFLIAWIALGGFIGLHHGFLECAIGILVSSAVAVPIFLLGAYKRAEFCDKELTRGINSALEKGD